MTTTIATAIVAAVYLGQLAAKTALALRYRARCHKDANDQARPETLPPVTILQPVVSGDPALAGTLRATLETFPPSVAQVFWLWLLDEDDTAAAEICETLAAKFPARSIKILRTAPPPQGVNPKVHKLIPALDLVATPHFVVLDDDTRLSAAGLRALLGALDAGASLATGLPRYHGTGGRWSACLAEFVNSSAVLAYLPALAFSGPVSIQGMCYAMRTAEARNLDAFRATSRQVADDLALALLLQRRKLRIHQTVEPHDIATSLPALRSLLRLMHRWFVFARLLLAEQPLAARAAIAFAYGLPPVLLWCAIGAAFFPPLPWNAALLLACLAAREIMLRVITKKFLGAETARERSPIASLAQELAQPFFLAAAYFNKTILWRNRPIRVRKVDDFEYL